MKNEACCFEVNLYKLLLFTSAAFTFMDAFNNTWNITLVGCLEIQLIACEAQCTDSRYHLPPWMLSKVY